MEALGVPKDAAGGGGGEPAPAGKAKGRRGKG